MGVPAIFFAMKPIALQRLEQIPRVQLAVVDPPWPMRRNKRSARPRQDASLPYQTAEWDEIWHFFDRWIIPKLDNDSHLFLWCPDRFLWHAESELRKRPFRVHARLVWDKEGRGLPMFYSVRRTHEYVIWAYMGRFIRPVSAVPKFNSVFRGKAATKHSSKPDSFFAMLDEMFPSLSRAEFFARRQRMGWICWPGFDPDE